MVAQPAEERHPADEEHRDEQKGEAEPGRVRGQPGRAAQHRVGVARRRERTAQERPDAWGRADREGATEQHARATPARAVQETAGDEAIRAREQTEERETGDDEDEAGDRPLRAVRQRARDQARRRAERDEHDREPRDERETRDCNAAPHSRIAKPLRVDGGDGGEITGHKREHARERDRREPGEKQQARFFHQAS